MNEQNSFKLVHRLFRAVVALGFASCAVVHAQLPVPGQMPLLTKTGVGVSPNIMLMLDDSGSMTFRHMPEDVFAGDTFVTSNPVGGNEVRWDPADVYQNGFLVGTVPGNISSANFVLRALRSPDTNTMYYNPENRYQPWMMNDGVMRMPSSSVTAAYLNPPLLATTAASTTSITIAAGSKLLTLTQTGKGFTVGQTVVVTSTASPTMNWMIGSITAFNASTGVITVNVTQTLGSGTFASWTLVQSPAVNLTTVVPVGTIAAGSFVIGTSYTIVSVGTTSFTAIGAANNNVGTTFTATAPGTGTGTASNLTGWCYANASNTTGTGTGNGQGCGPVTASFTHDPGVYFRLTKTGATYNSVTAYTQYTGFTINAAAATTYNKYANRLDCAGTVCTRDEERQNFANWYTYYRTRNLMARGSMMEAFGPQVTNVTAGSFVVGAKYSIVSAGTTPFTSIGAANNNVSTGFTATGVGTGTGVASTSTFRLGFGRINKSSASVDGQNTAVIESDTANYGGGGIREYNAARRVNLYRWLEDMPASGGTPLVTGLKAIGDYYSRTDNRGPYTDDPSVSNNITDNATCRRSYTIMTTDGYWNGATVSLGNVDAVAGTAITGVGTTYTYTPSKPYSDATSNTLADVAMYYWKRDLQPAMTNAVPPVGDNISFWQNMTTYTVGLGVRGTLDPNSDLPALTTGAKTWPPASASATAANVDDLWHSAVNSRGRFFSAKDPKQLADSIKTVLGEAAGSGGATAGVATASTVLSSTNRKYVPTFTPLSWSGDIAANPLDANGQVTAQVWNAAAKMPLWSSRNIVTWDSGLGTPAAVPFKWASITASNKSALGSVAVSYTTQFIDYLWGDHSQEGVGFPFRSRLDASGKPFILGDFVNGNPVLVLDSVNGLYGNLNLGSGTTVDPTYATFLANKAARTSVLFAGANDGMLHAFKDSKTGASTDGQEVFAYVPRAVYPNLYKLTDKTYGSAGALQHQFFVDGPLLEGDAYVKAPGASSASWRNYLMGALGAGGKGVFALDVTDLANLGVNTVRWELSSTDDSDIGYVLTPIRMGVLPNGRWVAVFGNGYSSTNGYATLFIVDIEYAASSNAAVRAGAITKINLDASGNNGLGGVTLIHDANGQISSIYVGDLKGKLWKLVYSAGAFTTYGGAAMFSATDASGTAQAITASPVVYNHPQGGQIVVFGTGKLFSTSDAADTSTQTIYGVWDKPAETMTRPLVRSTLATRTLAAFSGTGSAAGTTFYALAGTAVNWNTQRGWSVDLTGVLPGGRVVYPAQVFGFDTALISAVAPVQGTPSVCDSLTGTGLKLILPVQSGANPSNHVFDTGGDGVANASDSYAAGYKTAADGIDAIVRSQGTNLSDKGGGGSTGDCTGATCSQAGSPGGQCVASPKCPEANACLDLIASATQGMTVCRDTGAGGNALTPTRTYDRIWRRIINPPIR